MALTAPPPAPQTSDPSTFSARSDALVAWLATHVTEENAMLSSLTALAAGTALSISYTFDTTTTVGDPGAGKLRLNSATQNVATAILMDDLDNGGNTASGIIGAAITGSNVTKAFIRIEHQTNPAKFLTLAVTALLSPGGYSNVTASVVASSAASPFANADPVVVSLSPTGDKGDTGAKGDTGPGAGAATPAAGNVTLTNSSSFVQELGFTANNQYVKFPDATTMANAGHVFSLPNATAFFGRALDSAGKLVGILPPMSHSPIMLSDKSTAAGKWRVAGTPLVAMTGQTLNSTSLGSTTIKVLVVNIDADRDMILLGGTTLCSMVYDRNAGTFGAVTTVRATIGDRAFSAILSAANQVLVASCDGTTGMEAVTISLSGTTQTLNSGSKGTATLAANISANGFAGTPIQFAAGTLVFPIDRSSASGTFRIVTVSGTTPTIGAETTTLNSAGSVHLYVDGSSLISITGGGSGHTRSYTVSGTTPTGGTAASAFVTGSAASDWKTIPWGVSGWLLIGRNSSTSRAEAALLTRSSTTMSASAIATPLGALAAANGDIANHEVVIVSATKAVLAFQDPTGVSNAPTFNVLTNTGGTLTAGTAIAGVAHTGQTQRAGCFGIGISGTNALLWCGGAVYSISASGSSPTVTSINYGSFPVQSTNTAFGLAASQAYNGARPNNIVYSGSLAAILPVNSISTAVYDGQPVACQINAPDAASFDYDTRHGVNPQSVTLAMVPGVTNRSWAVNYTSTTYGWTLSCFEAVLA